LNTSDIIRQPHLPLKASSIESGSATMRNPGPALGKRKATTEQEFERNGSPKVAKCASHAPLPSHVTDMYPRTSFLIDTPGSSSSRQGSAKPQGLAASRPPTINTVIEDFDYQGGGAGMNSSDEEEDEGDNLEYPGDVAESLVCPTHLTSHTRS
jgi:hypothetical protein